MPTSIAPSVIDDTDAYTAAVQGATVEAVRVGEGSGPNVVVGLPGERVTVTSSRVGFPICTHSHVEDGHVVAAYFQTVAEPSQWSGIPLQPGMVILYGPDVEHMAINRPGLSFVFGITSTSHLEDLADLLEFSISPPSRGEAVALENPDVNRRLGEALSAHIHAAVDGGRIGGTVDEVMRSMAATLEDHSAPARSSRGLDSRVVVSRCLGYAEAEGVIPSLEELCRASNVSERRLRSAFSEEFDCPPSVYMRAWALDRANRRLREADSDSASVTEIAADLGFNHLGRFAGHYRSVFGESPSQTLKRIR